MLVKRRNNSDHALKLEHERERTVEQSSVVAYADSAVVYLPCQIYRHQNLQNKIKYAGNKLPKRDSVAFLFDIRDSVSDNRPVKIKEVGIQIVHAHIFGVLRLIKNTVNIRHFLVAARHSLIIVISQ